MNIVFVMIDTLRYDHVAANGNERVHTPNLDRFAATAWCFENYYAASFPTIPHRTDVLTGEYGGPFHAWLPLAFDRPTLPRALAAEGYATQLIHDTPHLVNGGHNFDWPFHAWTQIEGAEVSRPWIDRLDGPWPANWSADPLFDGLDDHGGKAPAALATYATANRHRQEEHEWNAARLFAKASRFLEDNRQRDRFLLWVDCFDPHEPWDSPPRCMMRYDTRPGYDGSLDPRSFVLRNHPDLSDDARAHIRAQYAAKTTWMDECFGQLLDALESTGLSRNTAVIVASDHGTQLGERGHFGKGTPVREQEGHCVLMIRVPERGSGRTSIIVQPQDLWATVTGIAGVATRQDIESYDVLALAAGGRPSPRGLALAGAAAGPHWGEDDGRILFTAFDGQWCLEFALRPEHCRLTRMGRINDVAADQGDVVERLREEALDEIARRGIDPELLAWLRREGAAPFPHPRRFFAGYPGPPGFHQYFRRLYEEQEV